MEKINKLVDIKEEILYDVIVIGTGPAGVSSAIYSARKGLKVAIIGIKIGGQVLDTKKIENIIGINSINGKEYAESLEEHLKNYDVYYKNGNIVKEIKEEGKNKVLITDDNKEYKSKTVIIATGSKYKELGVTGEKDFEGRGVHYCTTCDGPFYKGLEVAIAGGGNSGVEAAIDMAGIANKVVLIENTGELKADKILQEKLYQYKNISVYKDTSIKNIKGSEFVEKIEFIDNKSDKSFELNLDGLFVEIGLSPNTSFLNEFINKNSIGEIIIDENNMTNIKGIFAAGDCTNVKHKQIVVSVGEGAKAALSAFNYLMSEY